MSIPAALACFHFRPLFYLLHNDVDDRVGRSFLLSLLLLVDALPAAATRRVDGDNDDVVDVTSTELHVEGVGKGERQRQTGVAHYYCITRACCVDLSPITISKLNWTSTTATSHQQDPVYQVGVIAEDTSNRVST